jgi:hypothetical protein
MVRAMSSATARFGIWAGIRLGISVMASLIRVRSSAWAGVGLGSMLSLGLELWLGIRL